LSPTVCLYPLQAIKSIERVGLDAMAAEAGIDLWKLPFEDARPERLAYLAENKGKVPVVSAATWLQACKCLCMPVCWSHAATTNSQHGLTAYMP
jgi:hypothetical protein